MSGNVKEARENLVTIPSSSGFPSSELGTPRRQECNPRLNRRVPHTSVDVVIFLPVGFLFSYITPKKF